MFDDFEQFLDQFKTGPETRKAPWVLYRKGSDRDSWSAPGGTAYVPVATIVQMGVVQWGSETADDELTGVVSQALQAKYYGEPISFVQVLATDPAEAFLMTKVSCDGDSVTISWKSDVLLNIAYFAYIVYGGQLRTP